MPSEIDALRLVHELQVHELELEMQNQELRATRLEIEAGLARYTELFDFAPIGYASLSADGTILALNHHGTQLLGRERQRLMGRRFGVLVTERDRPIFNALIRSVLPGDGKKVAELELSCEEPLFTRLTAVLLGSQEPTILLAFEDVTERRDRERRLARVEEELRAMNRKKDAFLATLSHELRNPLAPIRNSLFVLERADPSGEQALMARSVIERQVAHLARIVDDLLDVTRITHGKLRLKTERIDLGEVVRHATDEHRSSFTACGVRLDVQPGRDPFWLDADPTRLSQMLGNLLGNAMKFTPREGQVEVRLEREGEMVALHVRDTGTGIPPELLAHLFEPFTQGPQSLDRSAGGLGLGLAMVKGLVELHGGTIGIASEGPGLGTEVVVRLPLKSGPRPSTPATKRVSVHRRVLVIEDNEDAADTMESVLELSGHDVRVAYDGPSGIAAARRFQPEIVLCDIGLPGMDGYEVAKTFRADAALARTHLVALSGYAQAADRQRSISAGFDEHVAKPPDLDALEQLIAGAGTAKG